MRETKYICDLCGEKHDKPKGDDPSKQTIYEFWFGWDKELGKNAYHVQVNMDSCHKHICHSCVLRVIKTAPAGITLP
jgi:hypothetical protein